MAYITKSEIESYMLQTIDASYDTFITTVISMIQTYIDSYCGQTFEVSVATDRYFDGDGGDTLVIGEFQSGSITGVSILDVTGTVIETLSLTTNYVEYPYNETTPNALKLIAGGTKRSEWPTWSHSIKVTGKFGTATVPSDIKLAALKLATKIINEGLRGGAASSETLGSYSITYEKIDEEAAPIGIFDILDGYRQIRL